MNHRRTRGIDVAVALVAVAFFVARRTFHVPVVLHWAMLAAMLVYTVWFLRRRSPYSRSTRPVP